MLREPRGRWSRHRSMTAPSARPALVLVALAALTVSCGSAGTPGSSGWPDGRTFLSLSVTDHGSERPLVQGTRIMLSFAEDGQLGAQAGCNHIGGTGRIDGDVLVVDAVSMTEMACDEPRMAQDSWLAGFLSSAPNIQLDGDALTLTGDSIQIRLIDRKVADPDRPLAGTRWVVDTIITGTAGTIGPDGAASSIPSGLHAELVLDGHGGLTGSTGCTPFSGTATVAGDRITVTMQATPDCESRAADLHRAVLATLRGEISYRIEGPRLTLLGPNGAGLGLRAQP